MIHPLHHLIPSELKKPQYSMGSRSAVSCHSHDQSQQKSQLLGKGFDGYPIINKQGYEFMTYELWIEQINNFWKPEGKQGKTHFLFSSIGSLMNFEGSSVRNRNEETTI